MFAFIIAAEMREIHMEDLDIKRLDHHGLVFEGLPLDRLFGRPMEAKDLNRFALARALDRIYEYGDSTLFSEIASMACVAEGVDRSIQSLDTTSFSMTGEYVGETEEDCIKIVHGYAKDHRPDLKQCVTELIVIGLTQASF